MTSFDGGLAPLADRLTADLREEFPGWDIKRVDGEWVATIPTGETVRATTSIHLRDRIHAHLGKRRS